MEEIGEDLLWLKITILNWQSNNTADYKIRAIQTCSNLKMSVCPDGGSRDFFLFS